MQSTQEITARKFLADLREEILRHPGVGHSLLGRMNEEIRLPMLPVRYSSSRKLRPGTRI